MSGLLILGAGGHGKVIADVAAMMGKWSTISFLDDTDGLDEVVGCQVIGKPERIREYKSQFDVFVAIGNNKVRLKWLEILINEGFRVPNIIHPSGIVSKFSLIGEGTAIMAGVAINAGSSLGRGCIVNTSSSVDHDCIIDDGVHISPGAHVSGTVHIGKCSWICVGSSIINNVTIGSNTTVAAGATVIRDVPDNVLVAGVPARIIKKFGDEHNEPTNIPLSASYVRE